MIKKLIKNIGLDLRLLFGSNKIKSYMILGRTRSNQHKIGFIKIDEQGVFRKFSFKKKFESASTYKIQPRSKVFLNNVDDKKIVIYLMKSFIRLNPYWIIVIVSDYDGKVDISEIGRCSTKIAEAGFSYGVQKVCADQKIASNPR